jgi:hypothetical protein
VDLITKVFEKKALRDEQHKFSLSLINFEIFKPYFQSLPKTILQKMSNADVLTVQNLKTKMKLV